MKRKNYQPNPAYVGDPKQRAIDLEVLSAGASLEHNSDCWVLILKQDITASTIVKAKFFRRTRTGFYAKFEGAYGQGEFYRYRDGFMPYDQDHKAMMALHLKLVDVEVELTGKLGSISTMRQLTHDAAARLRGDLVAERSMKGLSTLLDGIQQDYEFPGDTSHVEFGSWAHTLDCQGDGASRCYVYHLEGAAPPVLTLSVTVSRYQIAEVFCTDQYGTVYGHYPKTLAVDYS